MSVISDAWWGVVITGWEWGCSSDYGGLGCSTCQNDVGVSLDPRHRAHENTLAKC